MISASSSAASGILSGYFGTGASGAASSAESVLGGVREGEGRIRRRIFRRRIFWMWSLANSGRVREFDGGIFEQCAAFAGVTESLLLDPRANGN